MVPDESWVYVSVHGLWKWSISALFEMRIFNLYAGSYIRQMSAKALTMAKNGKKYNYLQPCLERRRSFNPMVYSMDGIPRTEAVAAHQCLAVLLSNKLKREHLEMCGFVRAWM